MEQQQDQRELDAKVLEGEVVIPSGMGGKLLDSQQILAEGFYSLLRIPEIFHYIWNKILQL